MLTDYHIHTTFCDGKNSAEEIAEKAHGLGFCCLGFSGHSYTPVKSDYYGPDTPDYSMTPEKTEAYRKEISRLKVIYANKGLDIFLGLEKDYISTDNEKDFDYCIGSVHYLELEGEAVEIDVSTPEKLLCISDKYFNGDFDALAEKYYETVGNLGERVNFDIIGHFDLIMKQCERGGFRMTERYLAAAKNAIDKLIPFGKPFEINVGAINRGYRTTPYPDKTLLAYIKEKGGKIVINGDCHSIDHLGKNREIAVNLAKKCGFTTQYVLTKDGWMDIPL